MTGPGGRGRGGEPGPEPEEAGPRRKGEPRRPGRYGPAPAPPSPSPSSSIAKSSPPASCRSRTSAILPLSLPPPRCRPGSAPDALPPRRGRATEAPAPPSWGGQSNSSRPRCHDGKGEPPLPPLNREHTGAKLGPLSPPGAAPAWLLPGYKPPRSDDPKERPGAQLAPKEERSHHSDPKNLVLLYKIIRTNSSDVR